MRILKNKNGFTILELLVVIGIIGLLAAIILAFMSGARDKSKDALIKREMQEARSEASIYHTDYQTFMYDPGGADADPENDTVCDRLSKFAQAAVGSAGTLSAGVMVVACANTDQQWAAEISLNEKDEIWCVDHTGYLGVSELYGERVCDDGVYCPNFSPYQSNQGTLRFECDQP